MFNCSWSIFFNVNVNSRKFSGYLVDFMFSSDVMSHACWPNGLGLIFWERGLNS